MTVSRDHYQQLLFAIARLPSQKVRIDLLQAELNAIRDWQAFFKQLELDGLAPLLYQHYQSLKLNIPTDQLTVLKSLVLRHKAIAKARHIALTELAEALKKAGIDWYALKGLALASLLYEEHSLRPMRDFDLLVPKNRIKDVAVIMRDLDYVLPEAQPSQYMRYTHQLPNAEKVINGFTVSVEIHHNAIGNDARNSLVFEDVDESMSFHWDSIECKTLGAEVMLHQISRHLEALHPGGRLKLVNVVDVVGFSEKYMNEINWSEIERQYPHVLNTLECLHLISPLSDKLIDKLKSRNDLNLTKPLHNVGEIMQPLTSILSNNKSILKKMQQLFFPSDWWLHLYYEVSPNKSLVWVKTLLHPFTLLKWMVVRYYSYLRGG